jgi:hypothetical protein
VSLKRTIKALNKRGAQILYHGVGEEDITGGLRVPFWLAYDRDLAEAYSDTGEVFEFEENAKNPLVLDTPEKIKGAWEEVKKTPGYPEYGEFDPDFPNTNYRFAEWAQKQGYDAVYIPEGAFQGEIGHEWAAGTFGEPQVIVLDPSIVKLVR